MNLELPDSQYSSSDVARLKDELVAINKFEPFTEPPKFADLINEGFDSWDRVKSNFKTDFRFFEKLLFRIHFKRKADFRAFERGNILKFLTIGYLMADDVRYFNEFLWFCKDDPDFKELRLLSLNHFKEITGENGCHSFPLCKAEEVESFIRSSESFDAEPISKEADKPLPKIGLIGTPSFFSAIDKELRENGYEVETFFIPYHSDKLKRIILKSGPIFRAYLLAKGINIKYTTLNFDHKDPRIQEILSSRKLDIGFHKLGFIIRDNIIDSFRTGLFNDHWGVLPFIRGRSTIEYSLLFGFPLGATVHKVEREVDTGAIVKIYTYEGITQSRTTIQSVKREIRNRLSARVVDSAKILSRIGEPRIANEKSKGLTFYSIHPTLSRYIEERILKSSD